MGMELVKIMEQDKLEIIKILIYIGVGIGIFIETGFFTTLFYSFCVFNFELNKELNT